VGREAFRSELDETLPRRQAGMGEVNMGKRLSPPHSKVSPPGAFFAGA
jgi:hypothetical protein